MRTTTKWDPDSYRNFVDSETMGEYRVIGNYVNTSTKIEHRHNTCGQIYMVRPNHFISGIRCPECAKRRVAAGRRRTTRQFKEEVFKAVGDEYEVLGDYLNAMTHIKMRHNECETEWDVHPNNFINGKTRCPKCFGTALKTTDQFTAEVFDVVGNEYSVLGDYVSSKLHIEMRHNSCGSTYTVEPSIFLRGNRCPTCNESRGERTIREYLIRGAYNYVTQFKEAECHDKRLLPFDFAIYLSNRILLIEYDGKQHFHPVDFAGRGDVWARQQFRELQRRDRIKTAYCKARGIPLIRISYEDFDRIDAILDEALAQYGAETPEVGAA